MPSIVAPHCVAVSAKISHNLSVTERIRDRLTRHVRKSVEHLAEARPISKEEAEAARQAESVRKSDSLKKSGKQTKVGRAALDPVCKTGSSRRSLQPIP